MKKILATIKSQNYNIIELLKRIRIENIPLNDIIAILNTTSEESILVAVLKKINIQNQQEFEKVFKFSDHNMSVVRYNASVIMARYTLLEVKEENEYVLFLFLVKKSNSENPNYKTEAETLLHKKFKTQIQEAENLKKQEERDKLEIQRKETEEIKITISEKIRNIDFVEVLKIFTRKDLIDFIKDEIKNLKISTKEEYLKLFSLIESLKNLEIRHIVIDLVSNKDTVSKSTVTYKDLSKLKINSSTYINNIISAIILQFFTEDIKNDEFLEYTTSNSPEIRKLSYPVMSKIFIDDIFLNLLIKKMQEPKYRNTCIELIITNCPSRIDENVIKEAIKSNSNSIKNLLIKILFDQRDKKF